MALLSTGPATAPFLVLVRQLQAPLRRTAAGARHAGLRARHRRVPDGSWRVKDLEPDRTVAEGYKATTPRSRRARRTCRRGAGRRASPPDSADGTSRRTGPSVIAATRCPTGLNAARRPSRCGSPGGTPDRGQPNSAGAPADGRPGGCRRGRSASVLFPDCSVRRRPSGAIRAISGPGAVVPAGLVVRGRRPARRPADLALHLDARCRNRRCRGVSRC